MTTPWWEEKPLRMQSTLNPAPILDTNVIQISYLFRAPNIWALPQVGVAYLLFH